MKHFVYILGSYDSVYVGPFEDQKTAWDFANEARENLNADAWVQTEADRNQDVIDYGHIPLYDPSEYSLERAEAFVI
jgi:hypothetical protein